MPNLYSYIAAVIVLHYTSVSARIKMIGIRTLALFQHNDYNENGLIPRVLLARATAANMARKTIVIAKFNIQLNLYASV